MEGHFLCRPNPSDHLLSNHLPGQLLLPDVRHHHRGEERPHLSHLPEVPQSVGVWQEGHHHRRNCQPHVGRRQPDIGPVSVHKVFFVHSMFCLVFFFIFALPP